VRVVSSSYEIMAPFHGREFSHSTLIFRPRSGTFEKPKSFHRNDNGLFANDLDERENPGGRAGIRKIHDRTLQFARVGKRRMVFLRACMKVSEMRKATLSPVRVVFPLSQIEIVTLRRFFYLARRGPWETGRNAAVRGNRLNFLNP